MHPVQKLALLQQRLIPFSSELVTSFAASCLSLGSSNT